MIKIYTANFEIAPMDMEGNFKKAQAVLSEAMKENCDIIVFPQGFLLGSPLGILKDNKFVIDRYNSYIHKLFSGAWISRVHILCDKIVDNEFRSTFYYQGHDLQGTSCVVGGLNVCACQTVQALFFDVDMRKKADLFLFNCSTPMVAGEISLYEKAFSAVAMAQGLYFVLCLGGQGYTTHPYFYKACVGVISKTESTLFSGYREVKNAPKIHNVDVSRSLFVRKFPTIATSFDIAFNRNPLIPANVKTKDYCLELFDMQAASLATRMKNIGCKDLVLNLSGGLDSTLAFLVCINTFDMLGLDRTGLHIVTMPGFGTSNKTKGLAESLCDIFGLSLITIDISDACYQALKDIGHDCITPDIVFENVQARMRTLNGLNIANQYNALMVGTGDLSEEALGFSTYGGDQLASYNVNCCISKTVIRTMLPFIIELPSFLSVSGVISEILDLPVSPELVPSGGEILQRTEEILAPYKLIDFFLYCLMVARISPTEAVEKAFVVFDGEFDKEYLLEKLNMFFKKFARGQFKRSCAPESAIITHVSLYGMDCFYPSDGVGTVLDADYE